MYKTTTLLALVLTSAVSLSAGEVAGVNMPDRLKTEGKDLVLNGMGLRTKAIFKVYVAGLYVETANHNAAALIAADQVKRVDLEMMRDLGKGKISEAIEEGFEKNSKAQLPALNERLQKFIAAVPDLKEGDHLVITYAPGKGTTLSAVGKDRVTIAGKDFADALFSVWLGSNPVDEKLKNGMVGG